MARCNYFLLQVSSIVSTPKDSYTAEMSHSPANIYNVNGGILNILTHTDLQIQQCFLVQT